MGTSCTSRVHFCPWFWQFGTTCLMSSTVQSETSYHLRDCRVSCASSTRQESKKRVCCTFVFPHREPSLPGGWRHLPHNRSFTRRPKQSSLVVELLLAILLLLHIVFSFCPKHGTHLLPTTELPKEKEIMFKPAKTFLLLKRVVMSNGHRPTLELHHLGT